MVAEKCSQEDLGATDEERCNKGNKGMLLVLNQEGLRGTHQQKTEKLITIQAETVTHVVDTAREKQVKAMRSGCNTIKAGVRKYRSGGSAVVENGRAT